MTPAAIYLERQLMPSSALADDSTELALRLEAQDRAALHAVYLAHHEVIRAFARRLLGDDDAAEELVHDVFVALPKAIRGFRRDAQLRTFLLSIAGNLSKNHIRAAVRKRRALNALATLPQAPSTDPEQSARQQELVRALAEALDELSFDHRLVFVLSEVEERSAAEVSEIVGVREATVRTRLFHAKQKLRERLSAGDHL